MVDKKKKIIVFTEEVDKKISGIALAFTFVLLGLFLLYNDNFIGNEIANNIIRWVYIVIGIFGIISEVKVKDNPIKGLSDILIGAILLAPFITIYIIFDSWILNLISFLLGTIGIHFIFCGIIKIIYSIKLLLSEKKKLGKFSLDLVLALTNILALLLVIAQVIQHFAGE
ncbi:MAG: hypothetical protein FWC67_02225 [Defluviitaleaceae bacterium]|nr:hypothetical protein [Defluviitaleaceae bacterium]